MLFRSLLMKREKRMTRDVLTLLPHIPRLFMTSPTQTAGNKMAAITVLFATMLKRRFLKNKTRTRVKNCNV